jgi:hypothetical protein
MKPKPEFADRLRKRKKYTLLEPDTRESDRLDLQYHLLDVHGTWIVGTMEALEEQHRWAHEFQAARG